MAAGMQGTQVEDSTLQLLVDQLEELVVTLVEEIRERPGVALAIFAGLVGAIVGIRVASRGAQSPARRVKRSAQSFGDAAELAGLVVRLLKNPIVRGLILAYMERQLRRRATG